MKLPLREIKWFVAECLGTLILALVVGTLVVGANFYGSSYQNLFLPLIVASVVAVLVYIMGPISGGHFNPAVSVGLWAAHKIRSVQLLVHVAAQVVGAYFGIVLVKALMQIHPQLGFSSTREAMLGEFLGAFILVATVTSVVEGKIKAEISGLAVGLALLVGVTISLIPSGGILNPALSLAFGGFRVTYLVAPLLGGVVGALLMSWLYQSSSTDN